MYTDDSGTPSRPARRAALYLRVSTSEQTTDNQRPALVQLCRARGFEIVGVYEEQVSGVAKNRTEFDRMMVHAHRGALDTIVVWAIDRIGRSVTGNLTAVVELDRIGVQVVSVREPWLDTGGPTRDLLLAVCSWVAAQERAQLVARTRAGLERARREGKQIGRPRARVDLDEAQVLLNRGVSLRKAAKKLGVGASTLCRLLKAQEAVQGLPGGRSARASLADFGVAPQVLEITAA